MPETPTIAPEVWHGHPLYESLDEPKQVDISVDFKVYDRVIQGFVPLYDSQNGTGITVTAALKHGTEPPLTIFSGLTDASGQLPVFSPLVPPSATLIFTCHVAGLSLAGETFLADFETGPEPMFAAVTSGLFDRTHEIRQYIYPQYEALWEFIRSQDPEMILGNSTDGPGALITADDQLIRTLRHFEQSYSASNFNVLFEGDSWLHYPPNDRGNQDLYHGIDALIRTGYAPPKPADPDAPPPKYRKVTMQHFGDTTAQMFGLNPGPGGENPEHTQFFHTKKYLHTYQFNVIFLSSGGNDIAEPGISTPEEKKEHDVEVYKPFFVKDPGVSSLHDYDQRYFEPYLANMISGSAAPDPGDKLPGHAGYWLKRSFSALLKNHRWFLYLDGRSDPDTDPQQQRTEADLNSGFDVKISLLIQEANLGTPDASLLAKLKNDRNTAMQTALTVFPDPNVDPLQRRVDFPDCVINSAANDILDMVFDRALFRNRFDEIKTNMGRFLDHVEKTQDKQRLLVLGHTYCYGMFSDKQTIFWGRHKGPWFHNRFKQARISNLFVQSASIKYLIDYFLWRVLLPLWEDYEFFDFVDARDLNRDPMLWNDEIHLETPGFKEVAARIFAKITAKFAQEFK